MGACCALVIVKAYGVWWACSHSFRQVLSSPPSAPHGQHGDAEDRTAVDLGVEDASEAGSSSTSSDEEHEAKVGSLGSLPTAAAMQDDLASFAAMAGLDVLDVDTVLTILKGKPHGEVSMRCCWCCVCVVCVTTTVAWVSQTGFSRDQFKEAMAVFAPKYVATCLCASLGKSHRDGGGGGGGWWPVRAVHCRRDSDADMEAYNTRVDGLFTSLDVDSNGVVDFAELGAGLSVLCGGSSGDKITAAFKLFDLNGDGVITEEEMTTYLTSVYRVIFETTPEVAQAMGVTPERLAEVTAADAFDTADADDDGEITLAEFRAWYAATSSDGLKQLIESRDAAAGGVEDAPSSSDTTSSDDSVGTTAVHPLPTARAHMCAWSRQDEGEALSVDELLRLTSLAQLHVKEVLVIMRRVATHSADAGSSSLDRAALERAMDLLRSSSFSTEPEDVQARYADACGPPPPPPRPWRPDSLPAGCHVQVCSFRGQAVRHLCRRQWRGALARGA